MQGALGRSRAYVYPLCAASSELALLAPLQVSCFLSEDKCTLYRRLARILQVTMKACFVGDNVSKHKSKIL